jgi:hypothetical protein
LRELTKEGRVVAIAYPTLAECYTLILRRLGRAYSGSWLDEVLDGMRMARLLAAVLSSRLEIPSVDLRNDGSQWSDELQTAW